MQYIGQICRLLKTRFSEQYRRIKKPCKIDNFLIVISNKLITLLAVFLFILLKRLHMVIIPLKDRNILRHELELKWIKLLQTPHQLGFNDNTYHEGNISRLPDLVFFSLLEIRKGNNRSHGKRKNGNLKRKNKHVLTLSELSIILKH